MEEDYLRKAKARLADVMMCEVPEYAQVSAQCAIAAALIAMVDRVDELVYKGQLSVYDFSREEASL